MYYFCYLDQTYGEVGKGGAEIEAEDFGLA